MRNSMEPRKYAAGGRGKRVRERSAESKKVYYIFWEIGVFMDVLHFL